MTVLRIRFQGTDYVLVGTLAEGGPIALEDDFRRGRVSYAHLYADGNISRYATSIGTRADIEVLGEADVTPADTAFEEMLFGTTFPVTARVAMLQGLAARIQRKRR